MPAEPVEEQVMAAMDARLKTIVAGSTYATTPVVDPELLDISQYKTPGDFPRLGVTADSGSTVDAVAHDRRQYDVRASVWGYVLGEPGVSARTQLNRLARDARDCLLADPSLGGLVQALDMVGGRDTDEGVLAPFGVFRQNWSARAVTAVPA